MRHGGVDDFDAEFFTPAFEFCAYELSAVIGDNPVWDAKSDHDVLEQFLCFSHCDHGYRFGFNPLSEFVDGDEEVCVTTRRFL